MAWKLVEIPHTQADATDLSDVEVVTIYLTLQHRMKGPYDDTNPEFTSYLKLTELFKVALAHVEQRSDETFERTAGVADGLPQI